MNVGIIGSGRWGRALATLVGEAGHQPRIGYRRVSPAGFLSTPNVQTLVSESDVALIAVPAGAVREVIQRAKPGPGARIVLAVRGLEPESGEWLSQVVAQESTAMRVGALAGPALASEIMQRRPSALVVASPYQDVTRLVQTALHSPICRLYTSSDLRGVELAGAAVGVLAAVIGVADALQLGAGVRGVIVVRGLAEITRLGHALGADADTFAGLAGVGDLVGAGCHTDQPEYQVGRKLAQGKTDDPLVTRILGEVRGLLALAERARVELPLSRALSEIAAGRVRPRLAFDALMRRSAQAERR